MKRRIADAILLPLAQRKGFEPLYTFLHNTISNRARSAAPPSLQQLIYYILFSIKKQLFLFHFIEKNRAIYKKLLCFYFS